MRISYYSLIPSHMMEAMRAYVEKGQPVGDFLRAVISNDLTEAVCRADDTNIWIIPIYVNWFYNECPGGIWGNDQAYDDWIKLNQKEK